MEGNKLQGLGEFGMLFNKNVTHILEKIFLPMDYDSFVSCSKVCKTWAELISSEPYQTKFLEKKNNKLCYYTIQGNTKGVCQLLSSGADPNCKMGVPLYHAITQDYYDVVKQLLNAGADPNQENRHGKSPLVLAFKRIKNKFESIEMIIQLLDAGADHDIAWLNINFNYSIGYRKIFDKIVEGWNGIRYRKILDKIVEGRKERVKKTADAKGANINDEQLDTSDEGQKYNGQWVDLAKEIQGDLFGRGPVLCSAILHTY